MPLIKFIESTELPTTQLELQMLHLLRRLRVKASVVVHAAAWQWIDPLQRDFSGVLLEIHGVFSFNVSVHMCAWSVVFN